MKLKLALPTISLIALATGCTGNTTQKNVDVEPIPIQRLDLAITDFTPADTAAADALQPGLDIYLSMMGADRNDLAGTLIALHESPVTTTFGADVKERFEVDGTLSQAISYAARTLPDSLPRVRLSGIYTIVSPYNQAIVVSDSIVLVALNHYMGADYEAYSGLPAYIREQKTPQRLPLDLAEALIRINYPYIPSDNATALERMLYEGSVGRAVRSTTLSSTPAAINGTTEDVYKALATEAPDLWLALSAEGVLYSTSDDEINRLFTTGPNGNIGRYFGLAIVDSYASLHPEATLEYLLSPEFYTPAQSRLIEAKYRP